MQFASEVSSLAALTCKLMGSSYQGGLCHANMLEHQSLTVKQEVLLPDILYSYSRVSSFCLQSQTTMNELMSALSPYIIPSAEVVLPRARGTIKLGRAL